VSALTCVRSACLITPSGCASLNPLYINSTSRVWRTREYPLQSRSRKHSDQRYSGLNVLDNVRNRIGVLTPGADDWRRPPLAGVLTPGTLSVEAVDDEESDDYFLTGSGIETMR